VIAEMQNGDVAGVGAQNSFHRNSPRRLSPRSFNLGGRGRDAKRLNFLLR
jgi:hypothetical protein